jgi:hypothetical protein
MVPLRNILKDLVSQDKGDEEDEEEEETEVEKKEPEAKKEEEEKEKVAESKKEEEKEKVAESKKEEEAAVAEAKKEEEKAAEAQKEAADVVVHPVLAAMANFANNEIVTPPQPHIVIDTTRNVGFSDYKTLFDSDNPDQSDIVDMGDDQESESLNILDGDAEPLRFDDAETIGGSSFQPSNPEAIGDGDFDTLT